MTLRVGHVTHTFGDISLSNIFDDLARIGYEGVEPFVHHVEPWYEDIEGFKAMLEACGLALSSVYYEAPLLDETRMDAEIQRGMQAARFLARLGGRHLVVGPGPMPATGVSGEVYARMATALDEFGSACREEGVYLCYHPHVGGTIENRTQIQTIFERTDPNKVSFVPDTGHLAKGGSELVEVVTAFLARVQFVHLKDMDENRTFVELGRGHLNNRRVLEILLNNGYSGWVVPEIPARDLSPVQSAAESYRVLRAMLDDLMA